MKPRAGLVVLGILLAALIGGMVVLFRLRLGSGDVYPVYSSLRADPLGTRALHDSLAELPGIRVGRNFKSIEALAALPPQTILLAGLTKDDWDGGFTWPEFDALNAAARNGSRVVLAFRAHRTADPDEEDMPAQRPNRTRPGARKSAEPKKDSKPGERKSGDNPGEDDETRPIVAQPAEMGKPWKVRMKERTFLESQREAVLADDAGAANLPKTVPWHSEAYFEPDAAADWRVIYRRGGSPVLLERRLGRGSVVLVADAYCLSNEALQRDRAVGLLSWLIGPHARITFDESHLGVVAQPGVAALARRYGLAGAFFTVIVLAALFVWREVAGFVPPADELDDVAFTYHPAAGLERLLRRAIPPAELGPACVTEWQRTASEADRARVGAALERTPVEAGPVAQYNAAVRAVRRRQR